VKITYPFEYIGTNRFGKIFRPAIPIFIFKKDLGVFVKKVLVVDSGADLTIFPRRDAALFGISLEKETIKDETFGVGGKETIFLFNGLIVKVGDIRLKIPCGFLDRNDVPALLGRQHFLELFHICFKDYTTTLQKMTLKKQLE